MIQSESIDVKRIKASSRTAHVETGHGCDILKQYLDTFFGPVPGIQLNIDTGAYDINSDVANLESPERPWATVNFLAHANLPRPAGRLVQYTRIIGSRNIKDSDVDINIPEVYQHGAVVPSKIGERITTILPWARRSFENMARISLTGLERFDNTMSGILREYFNLCYTLD